jgi:hypothetical protein
MQCDIIPTHAKFRFANSQTSIVRKCRVWFPTTPPINTDFDIVEEGTVPLFVLVGADAHFEIFIASQSRSFILCLTGAWLTKATFAHVHYTTSSVGPILVFKWSA